MKLWEQGLRQIIDIEAIQFGFMPGRGTTDAIFVPRQLQEKFNEGAKRVVYDICRLGKSF